VQGKAEHYFLPVYNARSINPEYHSHLSYYKLIQQTIATVTKQQKIQNNICKSYLATVAMAQSNLYLSNGYGYLATIAKQPHCCYASGHLSLWQH